MKPSAQHYLDHFGLLSTDVAVTQVLKTLGFAGAVKRPKRGEVETNVPFLEKGIELIFTKVEEVPGLSASSFSEGALALTTVFFYSASKVESRAFSDLPAGLEFKSTRGEVRALLGQPEWSSPVVNNDRWAFPQYTVTIDFAENESSIVVVTATALFT